MNKKRYICTLLPRVSSSLFYDVSKELKSEESNGKTKHQSKSTVDKRDSYMDMEAGKENHSGTNEIGEWCEETAANGRGEHKQKQQNRVKGVGSSTHSFFLQ